MCKEQDLYLEFGDGSILVLTSEDNKIILSRRNGQGKIGEKGPIKQGDEYVPSGNDVVMKFKNIESLLVLKKAVEDIERDLKISKGKRSIAGGIANPAEHWESVARSNFKRIENLEEALKESVKLQSHYAQLLNMHDGGERLQFNNVDEWVDRLRSLKYRKESK